MKKKILPPVLLFVFFKNPSFFLFSQDDFDRAASLGMGSFKVAGNYVAALLPNEIAARQGHPITLFLDPIHHRYIEEFNSSNFIAVTKDGTYITPASSSILPR